MINYDVVVIGGGPAGLAASSSSAQEGRKVLLIEREACLGGILKQCIHDGFGLHRFKERLTGTEYAYREIKKLNDNVDVSLLTFVINIKEEDDKYIITTVSKKGITEILTTSIILATGCRERTSKQVGIYGTSPSGVMTAGACQYYINVLGKMTTKKCVILGSGDIGLIMARRITLEGGIVEGVYEIKSTPSGLTRNISQCLNDYNIPLYLSHTVTKVFGKDRLEAVEVAKVDNNFKVIEESRRLIECDSLILSVGLIPENEVASLINIKINNKTKGPVVDQTLMTNKYNVYCCGNALHVNDLVDYVSESGEIAGKSCCKKRVEEDILDIKIDNNFGYIVPTIINKNKDLNNIILYFRVKEEMDNKTLKINIDGKTIETKKYSHLRPPEMQRFIIDLTNYKDASELELRIED